MNWHYSLNGADHGPVDTAELARLAGQGVVTAETLVWREGMAGWEPYAQAIGAAPPVMGDGVACSQCGRTFAADQVIRLGNDPVCAACKPKAVQKLREGVPASLAAEDIRQAHIGHEASVRSIGVLYLLGAVLLMVAAVGLFFTLATRLAGVDALQMGIFAAMLALGGLQFWTGLAIRRLRPWSRVAAGVVSGIGLLGFPIGTLINGYILYLLFSRKGATVFSEDYQRVIAQTPHVRYRTSLFLWVVLGLVVLLVGFGILAAVLGGRR